MLSKQILDAIKDIIHIDVVLEIITGEKKLILKENSKDSKINKLHITNLPENTFAFTLDHQPKSKESRLYKQLSCYFNIGNNRINKGCDLVLLIPEENKLIALIFDLKSDQIKLEKTKIQLLNSELYVRYLMSMVKAHYQVNIDDIEYKQAVVSTIPRNGINRNSTYKPNDRKNQNQSFHIQKVKVQAKKQAFVHIKALLQ